jgi:hypothetical protein
MDTGVKQLKLESLQTEGDAHTACDVGKVILLGTEGQVIDTGKYVVVWKNEQGQWKVHRDIWNTNSPAPSRDRVQGAGEGIHDERARNK